MTERDYLHGVADAVRKRWQGNLVRALARQSQPDAGSVFCGPCDRFPVRVSDVVWSVPRVGTSVEPKHHLLVRRVPEVHSVHARHFDFDLAVLVLPLADCHTIGRRLEKSVGCSVLALHNREVSEAEGHCWLPSSRRVLDFLPHHGLPGSYRLVRWIRTDKRVCIDCSGEVPGSSACAPSVHESNVFNSFGLAFERKQIPRFIGNVSS
jgi:hypothetical protein